ncbi:MAG: DEAD/DEAH box helicase, partial [Ilumatobacter sp.]|nr:DEAD/DEAH box helicase [Ilumatobacter sp.]
MTDDSAAPPASSEPGEALAALAQATAALDNAEDRPGQFEMARLVEQSIASGKHLVVQAGTGTGKTLAYLVPAITGEKRVVIATATKALQ